uniref:Transmembrane protein n=1 Tax=Solanum lycopersicum TaxID=4081 RepID=A0A3Q7FIP3_SOLLC
MGLHRLEASVTVVALPHYCCWFGTATVSPVMEELVATACFIVSVFYVIGPRRWRRIRIKRKEWKRKERGSNSTEKEIGRSDDG